MVVTCLRTREQEGDSTASKMLVRRRVYLEFTLPFYEHLKVSKYIDYEHNIRKRESEFVSSEADFNRRSN
jgi:hypothetical protein